MKKKSNYIPTKNYVIAALVVVGTILLGLYIFSWIRIKEEEKYLESYLLSTNTTVLHINTLEELESTLLEIPDNYFIFTGYTGDEEEYELEKDLKPIIDDYGIQNIFYYLDITELMDEENFLAELSDILDKEITTLPTILYCINNKVENQTTTEDGEYLEASDFEKLLEMYEFEKSN